MNYKILLIVFFGIAVSIVSCKKKTQEVISTDTDIEEVQKIGYSLFGGWIGTGYNLVITPDSIHYFYEVMTTREAGKYEALTSAEMWSALLKEVDLNEFEKIESTPSIQEVDGSDSEFFVETNKRRLSFINGESNEHYRKLKPFFDTVIKLEYECREKSVKSKIEYN
ncbi:hypothetical protein D0T84_13080 [Dysgonomonas sp. 521]|uniref:hypothetical protein n=1 Tax=Dysgonomonas sp. 521 TaxID=2302932 RepID=UPI0013D5D4AE|nr:hypothetical protein [Dysgonomonas sp. 521]NDV95837.1 hypothetical protein [Dysgonomonas sp. 521]